MTQGEIILMHVKPAERRTNTPEIYIGTKRWNVAKKSATNAKFARGNITIKQTITSIC